MGINRQEFDLMTFHELNICADLYNEQRKEDALNEMYLCITNSYYTEYFHRQEKLKSLKYYVEDEFKLGQDKPKEVQTQNQMLTQIETLNSLFGGRVEYVTTDESFD